MNVTRRDFLKFCGASATALGLGATDLLRLKDVLAAPGTPPVIWLQGSACTGCSISFLNLISEFAAGTFDDPVNAADVLTKSINLIYHPNLMALAGDSAVAEVEKAYHAGGYLLAIEGGVPTKFNGNACWAWNYNGEDVTFQEAVVDLSARAAGILCIGTCASFGGIPAAPPNPTGVKSVKAVTGKATINIAGCPPHPNWIAWTVAQLLLGNPIPLDSFGRPTELFSGYTIHDMCRRRSSYDAGLKAQSFGVDALCLIDLGCRGPETVANCPFQRWNGANNWCVDANAPCLGCTNSTFPSASPFYRSVVTNRRDDD
jgi:hydrogenase small subunit